MNKDQLSSHQLRARRKALKLAEKQVEQFQADMLEFVGRVALAGCRPETWPLTQQEQIAFIREVVGTARKLHSSEMFFVLDMRLKCAAMKGGAS